MMGGRFDLKKPIGSSSALDLTSGFSRERKLCESLNLSVNKVVFPACLGPVIKTAGKVFMALLILFSKILGSMMVFLTWPNLNFNFKFGQNY